MCIRDRREPSVVHSMRQQPGLGMFCVSSSRRPSSPPRGSSMRSGSSDDLFRIFNVTSTSLQRERPRRFSAFLCSPWRTRQGEDARPKISEIDFGVEVWLKALCFRHKQLLILPGGPGFLLARARVRGAVDAVRLGGYDQKRTEDLAPVLAPVHGSLRLRRRDVAEAARDVRRRRRCRERAHPSLSGGGPRRAHAAPGM